MTVLAPLLPLALTALSALAPVDDIEPEAREHLDRGLASYNDKAYGAAIRELQIAYALDPRPEIVFAWAQAERLYGRCSRATKLYHRFLKSRPSQQQADAANLGLDRCEGMPDLATRDADDSAEGTAFDPEPTPLDVHDAPAPATTSSSPAEPRARRVDGLGVGLLSAGVVLGSVGAGLLGAAQSTAKHADDGPPNYDQYAADAGQVQRLRLGGGVLAGIGGALIVAGVVKLLVHRRAARRDLAFWADPVGAGASLRLRF